MVEQHFKMTEVGLIPEDWEVSALGKLIDKNPDYGINAAAVPYNDMLPTYLRITDISESGQYIPEGRVSVDHKLSEQYVLEPRDIVVARTGASTGKTYYYHPKDGLLVFAGFLIRIQTNIQKLTPEYLYYHTRSGRYRNWIIENSTRSGQPGINSQQLKEFILPHPNTLPEQRAIATALSDADSWIESLEKLLAKKRLIKQGAMQRFLTPGEDWEVRKLTDVVDYIHGKAHEQHISEFGDYVVVNSKFISTDGEIRKYSNENFCPARKDDILTVLSDLPNGKALAKCFLVDKDNIYAVNQRICIWRSKGANSDFLSKILNRNKYFMALNDGVSQTHILNHHIEKCEISIPISVEEQTRIATILSDMDAEIESLEKKLQKAKQIKQGMMQLLLTGKVRLVGKGEMAAERV